MELHAIACSSMYSGRMCMGNPSRDLLRLFVCLVLCIGTLPLFAQQSQTRAHPHTPAAQQKKKLTQPPTNAALQERGLQQLRAAVTEAASLQPNMRAYVLWRASYAYATTDPKTSAKLSRDAFTSTLSIDDPPAANPCGGPLGTGNIKSWIQERVLLDMVHQDNVVEVQQLLPNAETSVRNRITTELVRYYVDKKQYGKAEELLSQLADAEQYPFGAAADLLLAMGAERSAERMALFSQALSNFEQHPGTGAFNPEDIGSFIERTWDHVPPALALEAVDKILDSAKSQESHAHFSMTSEKGSVALNSVYQLRLFQLLPVLEQLDKDRAEALMRDNAELQAQLQKYPKGMQSLNSDQTFFSYGISDQGSPAPVAGAQGANAQLNQRMFDIVRDAEKDPALALSEALGLPVQSPGLPTSPRAQTLAQIASAAARRKPAIAKSALAEIVKVEDQLAPEEMRDLAKVPVLYLALGDEEGARDALKMLLKAADKIYAHDNDAEDPNRAFKGIWRSSDMWRQCVQAAAAISPDLAEEVLGQIPDPEIEALEKVVFASMLLQAPHVPNLVVDCRKSGSLFSVSD